MNYLIKIGCATYHIHGDSPEEALAKLKKAGNGARQTGTHGVLRVPGDYNIEFNHNPDFESLTVDDVLPNTLYTAVRLAGCGCCGGEFKETEQGLGCSRCGAKPCTVEDGDWPICGRCGTPTVGNCHQCNRCDCWDEQYEEQDPKTAARLMAWEELGECAAAGLSTDHIAETYGL
jgi:hypothetical protein